MFNLAVILWVWLGGFFTIGAISFMVDAARAEGMFLWALILTGAWIASVVTFIGYSPFRDWVDKKTSDDI